MTFPWEQRFGRKAKRIAPRTEKIAAATEGGTLSDIEAASITLEGKTGSGTDKINAGWGGDTTSLPDSDSLKAFDANVTLSSTSIFK